MIKVKPNFNFKELELLGYRENMLEGGFVAPNMATIVINNREPYIREVMQFTPNEEAHNKNVATLQVKGFLE